MAGTGTVIRAQGIQELVKSLLCLVETQSAPFVSDYEGSAVNIGWHHGTDPSLCGRVFLMEEFLV